MSFYIGGEPDITKISRDSFIISAKEMGMSTKEVAKTFDEVAAQFERALNISAESLNGIGYKNALELKEKILLMGGFKKIK